MQAGLCLARLLLLASQVTTFNLETRAPVVKLGPPDSFFGFSVAQHQMGKGRQGGGQPVMLVGAPQGRNLQPGTNHSGALYTCPLSSSTRDCTQVVTDGKRHSNGIYDGRIKNLNRPISEEIKDGQWLGVAVSSQGPGGQVIVCAHRYTVRNSIDSKRAMLGMCYILESDLSLPATHNIGALNILVVREALRGKRMSTDKDFDNHARYGVCQLGTSVAWARPAQTGGLAENYALLGAPGCFTWRGNMFGQKTDSIAKYQTAVGEENFLELTKHGHLGLSVTSGRFYNGQVQYVSGAPHVSLGQAGNGTIYFYEHNLLTDQLELDTDRTLVGSGFGSGFGFSLATLDANGDGQDDLLVSAPFIDNDGRGGAVYLYLNYDQSLHQDGFLEIRGQVWPDGQFGLALTTLGDTNKDGYEDFAVGAPYEGEGVVYLFLGGPGGLGASGQGKKGVYHTFGAEVLASQVIKPSDFHGLPASPILPGFGTFGASLSGGMDLDDNRYPDLLIGAYNSATTVLLRSRPIISVKTSLEDSLLHSIDPGQAGCSMDPDSSHSCFHFQACFWVESDKQELDMRIKFRIVGEPKKAVSRVWLRLADQDNELNTQEGRSSKVDHILLIQAGGDRHCTTIIGYVSDSQSDLQTPVEFALSYSLDQLEPLVSFNRGQPLPKLSPILDQQQARRTFYAKFQKNCGEDDVCQAMLDITSRLLDQDQELGRSRQGAYQLELGTLSSNELVLEVVVTNFGEAAYEATLDIAFSSSLSYVGLGAGSEVNSPNLVNSSYLSVDLGNPFKGTSEEKGPHTAKLRLRFSPSSVINQTLIKFDFLANTSSELAVGSTSLTFLHCVVVKRAEVTVGGRGSPETLFYGGEVRGESAIRDVTEVGPLVNHRYLIKNYGPSMVDVLTVNISWPFQVENNKQQGKWLLYLTSHPLVRNGAGSCHLPPGTSSNPLNLTSKKEMSNRKRRPKSVMKNSLENFDTLLVDKLRHVKSEHKRQRREVEQIVAPLRLDGETLLIRLDCAWGTAKCLNITCQVYNLKANSSFTIEVKSRLWNATLVEDYSDIDKVEIVSRASVVVNPAYTQDIKNDYMAIVTIALPDLKLEPLEQVSWWIYVVAVVCGILVLMAIVIILSKLGFFKRKRPDEDTDYMVSANFEKVRLNPDDS